MIAEIPHDLWLESLLLFASAFLAATLLPFYSEVILVGLTLSFPDWLVWLVIVASIGNTLGSWVNWMMGRYLLHYADRPWWPFKPQQLERAQRWFQRFGTWSLLLAWAPIGGDALTFIAGIMRVNVWLFLLLVGIGKTLRYVVVAGLGDQIAAWF